MNSQFLLTFLLITASMGGGYLCRHWRLVNENSATWMMTAVAVFGYPTISLLSIWSVRLQVNDIWLPVLACVQMTVQAFMAIPMAYKLTRERGQIGLFAISSAAGNNGMTMGGFIIYMLFGVAGLGLGNVYFLLFTPMIILLCYPLARHYSGFHPPASLGRLLLASLLDWRSIGLVMAIAGILLSVFRVPRPQQVVDWHIVDILMYAINFFAYFAIGLRLRLSHVMPLKGMIAALAGTRFVLGAALGLGFWGLTLLTPWPLAGLGRDVLLIQAFVPTAVTNVAVANMFNLRPRDASVLFVTNTVMYLLIILPVVMWAFGPGGPLR